MKKRLLSVVLCMAVTAGMLIGCGSKANDEGKKEEEKKTIRISTTGEHAFFSETNDDGELQGFNIVLWNQIGNRLE